MVEAVAAKPKSKKSEREPSPAEAIFQRKEPLKDKVGRDGVPYTIFHNVGAAGGAFTRNDLMDISQIGTKLKAAKAKAEKLPPLRRAEKIMIAEVRAAVEYRRMISKAKRDIKKEYASQGLLPLFAFARMHATDEPRLAIWGFMNKKCKLVIGQANDAAIWDISVLGASNGIARLNHRARLLVDDLVTLGISKDNKESLLRLTGKK